MNDQEGTRRGRGGRLGDEHEAAWALHGTAGGSGRGSAEAGVLWAQRRLRHASLLWSPSVCAVHTAMGVLCARPPPRYARPARMNGPQRPPVMDGWQRPPRWTGALPESAQVAAQPRAHPSSLCADSKGGDGGAEAAPSPHGKRRGQLRAVGAGPFRCVAETAPYTPPPPPRHAHPAATHHRALLLPLCRGGPAPPAHPSLKTPARAPAPRRPTAADGRTWSSAAPGAARRCPPAERICRVSSVAALRRDKRSARRVDQRRRHCWHAGRTRAGGIKIDGEGQRWVGTRGRRGASWGTRDAPRISYGRRASPSNRRCTCGWRLALHFCTVVPLSCSNAMGGGWQDSAYRSVGVFTDTSGSKKSHQSTPARIGAQPLPRGGQPRRPPPRCVLAPNPRR